MSTAILIIIIINLFTIVLLFGTTKYLNYIDKKAQKHFEETRLMIEYLEREDRYF